MHMHLDTRKITMWIANYICANTDCDFLVTKLFENKENAPKTLNEEKCPLCNSSLIYFNFKNNSQRWKFRDSE